MENRSFEDESANSNLPKDQLDNPSGPLESEAETGISDESRCQPKESSGPLPDKSKDDDDESPPAYVKRYLQEEKKTDDLDGPDSVPPEPLPASQDLRQDPLFQQQARNRMARRSRQGSVEGPCSLRQDSPDLPALPVPEPYPEQQSADAPENRQQPVRPRYPGTWRGMCVSLYQRICTFSFQFPFHTLLLTWPLSNAVMGVMNLKVCRIDPFFPYVMLAVGMLGASAVLLRLYTLYFEKRVTLHVQTTRKYWIGLRIAELIVWKFFAIQLYYFFKHDPSFTPGERYFCKWRFYKINCGLMFLTFLTMIGWILVHVAKLIYWFRRRNVRVNA